MPSFSTILKLHLILTSWRRQQQQQQTYVVMHYVYVIIVPNAPLDCCQLVVHFLFWSNDLWNCRHFNFQNLKFFISYSFYHAYLYFQDWMFWFRCLLLTFLMFQAFKTKNCSTWNVSENLWIIEAKITIWLLDLTEKDSIFCSSETYFDYCTIFRPISDFHFQFLWITQQIKTRQSDSLSCEASLEN